MRVVDSHPIPPPCPVRLWSLSKRHASVPYRIIYTSSFRPMRCQHTLPLARFPCRPALRSGLPFRLACSPPTSKSSRVSLGFPQDSCVRSLHNARVKATPTRQINRHWPFLRPPYIFWPVTGAAADNGSCSSRLISLTWPAAVGLARSFLTLTFHLLSRPLFLLLFSALWIYPTSVFFPADHLWLPSALPALLVPEPASSAVFPSSIRVSCFSPHWGSPFVFDVWSWHQEVNNYSSSISMNGMLMGEGFTSLSFS